MVGDGERWGPEALAKHKVAGSTPVIRSVSKKITDARAPAHLPAARRARYLRADRLPRESNGRGVALHKPLS